MALDLVMTTPGYAAAHFGNGLNAGRGSVAGALPTSGTFTITAWVKQNTSGLKIAVGQVNAFWFGLDATGKAIANYGVGGTAVSLTSATALDDAIDHYIELVIGVSGGALYVDGTSVASSIIGDSAAGVDRTTNPFEVAAFDAGFSWFGSGVGFVDEVALWSSALASHTPPGSAYTGGEANLVALWHFNSDGLDSKTGGAPGLEIPRNLFVSHAAGRASNF